MNHIFHQLYIAPHIRKLEDLTDPVADDDLITEMKTKVKRLKSHLNDIEVNKPLPQGITAQIAHKARKTRTPKQ